MINKVTLIGRLGNDPEIRHLEGGVAVARISLATNDFYRDKDGNPQETTEWHNVVMWRDLAERAEKQLKKGGLMYVEGKISYRKYTVFMTKYPWFAMCFCPPAIAVHDDGNMRRKFIEVNIFNQWWHKLL